MYAYISETNMDLNRINTNQHQIKSMIHQVENGAIRQIWRSSFRGTETFNGNNQTEWLLEVAPPQPNLQEDAHQEMMQRQAFDQGYLRGLQHAEADASNRAAKAGGAANGEGGGKGSGSGAASSRKGMPTLFSILEENKNAKEAIEILAKASTTKGTEEGEGADEGKGADEEAICK
jgi:hypothetical protein